MLERLALLTALSAAAIAPTFAQATESLSAESEPKFLGFPEEFGSMRRLKLSPVESSFARDFPGKIGKFEQAGKQYVVRFITAPTRMLHPAADCFRASGFAVTPLPRCMAPQAEATACFHAASHAQNLLVSESIHDSQGQEFSDVSAWYWATQTGSTQGPWWSITVISRASD